MTEYIMVLDDGETYSGLEQCHVIEILPGAFDPADDVHDELERRLDSLMRTDLTELGGLRVVQAFAGPESVLDDDLRAALGIVVEAAHLWCDVLDDSDRSNDTERIEDAIYRIARFRRDTDPNI